MKKKDKNKIHPLNKFLHRWGGIVSLLTAAAIWLYPMRTAQGSISTFVAFVAGAYFWIRFMDWLELLPRATRYERLAKRVKLMEQVWLHTTSKVEPGKKEPGQEGPKQEEPKET